jgi:hypothetical protein
MDFLEEISLGSLELTIEKLLLKLEVKHKIKQIKLQTPKKKDVCNQVLLQTKKIKFCQNQNSLLNTMIQVQKEVQEVVRILIH